MEYYPILLKGIRDQEDLLVLSAKTGHLRLFPYFDYSSVDNIITSFLTAIQNGHLEVVKVITKLFPSAIYRTIHTGLIKAVECNYLEIVEYLLDDGVHIYYSNNLALKKACRAGNLRMTQLLIQKGASLRDDDEEHILSQVGDVDILQFILSLADHNKDDLEFCLLSAASRNNLELIQYLLGLERDQINYFEIFISALNENNKDVVRCLIDNGVNIKNYPNLLRDKIMKEV